LTDWLELCRAAVADVEAVLLDMTTRAERERVLGTGKGGDETTAIDQAAEDAIIARFRETGATIVSEEVGIIEGSDTVVVIDPIDGSLNAKRGIPFFSLSIAVAERSGHGDRLPPLPSTEALGERLEPVPVAAFMDDVHFGFVHDFGSGEEWRACRGEGAWLNGQPLGAVRPKDEIEILVFEATSTRLVAQESPKVAALAHRLRIMGSTALSLCHLAAGRVDGVCTLKPTRSVDIAAGQLLCRELGLALELFDVDEPFGAAPLDLGQRSRLAAAGTSDVCTQIARALSA
jgi:myo-inositol-1(or 4)-monophosphatase